MDTAVGQWLLVGVGVGYESCSSRSASQSPATSQDAACQTASSGRRDGDDDDCRWTSSGHHESVAAAVPLCSSLSTTVNGCGSAAAHHQNGSVAPCRRGVGGMPVSVSSQLRHRHLTDQHHHRSLPALTKQHGQLVHSMTRLLEIDGIDLTKHPHTNYVRIQTATVWQL